jgi:hypothetical protein
MILTFRGTSGSGKTTLARRIMEHYGERKPFHRSGRKQPLFYDLDRADGGRTLRILGHYESPTGGGDTISDGQDYIAELVREAHGHGRDVIYEGLVISSDFSRVAAMHAEGFPVAVIALNTPLQVCLESVAQRRAAKGNTNPLNPKTTTEKHRAVAAMVPRFRAAGVPTHHVDREEAYRIACELLKLEPPAHMGELK